MLLCEQMPGMNMLQHGQSVHSYYKDLFYHLKFGANKKYQWKISEALQEHGKLLTSKCTPMEHAELYHVYHDCGKPRCRTVDEDGRQHFPDHARHSYEAWMEATGDEDIGWFILHDMDLHTLRGDELRDFLKSGDPRIPTLLLTAWAEIHANCSMFGGIETTSFKIKWKHLEKITRWYLG